MYCQCVSLARALPFGPCGPSGLFVYQPLHKGASEFLKCGQTTPSRRDHISNITDTMLRHNPTDKVD